MKNNNTLAWELISHLWFLLVLVILTTVSIGIFTWFQKRQETSKPRPAAISLAKLSLIFFLAGGGVRCYQAHYIHRISGNPQ